jgi:hypothetical protein
MNVLDVVAVMIVGVEVLDVVVAVDVTRVLRTVLVPIDDGVTV